MAKLIDPRHFKDLAKMDPEAVCRRALCGYNNDKRCYTLSLWGDAYDIYPGKAAIVPNGSAPSHMDTLFGLFMVHYLLTAKEIPIRKEWISEKDIPGGETFFRGPHEIPTYLIEKRYGNDVNGFAGKCEELEGTPLEMADEAYAFKIAPRIPLAILLWKGDDEFPTESKMLFDRSIIQHLALDIIFSLAVEVCSKLADSRINGT